MIPQSPLQVPKTPPMHITHFQYDESTCLLLLLLLALSTRCPSQTVSKHTFSHGQAIQLRRKLTVRRPLLLWRPFPSQLCNLKTLQSIFFLLIPCHEVESRKFFLAIFDCRALTWVVCGEGRSF